MSTFGWIIIVAGIGYLVFDYLRKNQSNFFPAKSEVDVPSEVSAKVAKSVETAYNKFQRLVTSRKLLVACGVEKSKIDELIKPILPSLLEDETEEETK